MSNFKLKNGNYIDATGIKYNNNILSDVLKNTTNLFSKTKTSATGTIEFNIKEMGTSGRTIYFYMIMSITGSIIAGLAAINNGNLFNHPIVGNVNIEYTNNSILKFSGVGIWPAITLIGGNEIIS